MEQRRKIVIPVGDEAREGSAPKNYDGAATVRAPLFDEEATMGARPVVPLAEASAPRSSRFPLLALVVLLAVSAGVAGGFAIGIYKSQQNHQAADAVSPAATTTAGTQPSSAQASVPVKEPQQQLPATIATEKSPASVTRNVPPAEDATAARPARDKSAKRDDKDRDEQDEELAPVKVRERDERIARDRDREEAREIRRQERRERRRRAREAEEADTDVNRQIEHGARELNRIREIFEGPRP